ncbi:hypothetical protein, partial [Rubripirellula obstinata]|uniref:hypothetical protein n=1 Tax=Rubripirellula obstinata TaxID=406547 RepID=UPI00138FB53A
DGSHRNGGFRITIACTGVAAARFPLCLHVKSRHLGDAYRYPTETTLNRVATLTADAIRYLPKMRSTNSLERRRGRHAAMVR